MSTARPMWPPWARNLFVLQLLLNFVVWVAVFGLIYIERTRLRATLEAANERVAAHGREVEKLDGKIEKVDDRMGAVVEELRGWWAVDTRNMREEVRAEMDKALKERR